MAGSGTGGTAIYGPVDLFLTSNGTLYEAEWGGFQVQAFLFNNANAVLTQKGVNNPRGICFDERSLSYYVAGNDQVRKWPSNTTILAFSGAFGIAIDSGGNLYVSSEFLNIIVRWNATSNLTATILSGLSSPRHIYLDEPNQFIYVADRLNFRVIRSDLSGGSRVIVAGGNGNGAAANQLSDPCGVYVSSQSGTVYVADTGNNRIQKWTSNATFGITIVGYANGTAGIGLYGLNAPYAVILDASETFLYVPDLNNNRIQRILIA